MIKSKVAAVFLFCLGLFCLAQAQVPMTGAGKGAPGGGSTPLSLWVAAVIAAGGSVSGTQQTRVGALISAFPDVSTCDGFWLFDAENSQQTKISIAPGNQAWAVTTSTVTLGATGSSLDVAGGGNGTVDSGINLSTATNYKQNSGTLFFYETIVDTGGGNVTPIGVNNNAVWSVIEERGAATAGSGTNVTAGDFGVVPVTHTTGLFVASRTNATTTGDPLTVFNAANTGGITNTGSADVSSAVPNLNSYLFAVNNNGTSAGGTIGATGATMAAMGICAGFNSTQITSLSTALNGGYLTARGHNVY